MRRSFVVNPALLEALTPEVRESLRRMAISRLVEHFGEGECGRGDGGEGDWVEQAGLIRCCCNN